MTDNSRRLLEGALHPMKGFLRLLVFLSIRYDVSVAVNHQPDSTPKTQVLRRVPEMSQSAFTELDKPESTNKTGSKVKKESWALKKALARAQAAGQTSYTVIMPATFASAMSDVWKKYAWQVRTGRYGRTSVFTPMSQITNAVCHELGVSQVKLKSAGAFGENTMVDMTISSKCQGEYCWQSFGYTSRGTVKSAQAGLLRLAFPQRLPELGDCSILAGPGENGAWCSPSEEVYPGGRPEFISELNYNVTGVMSLFERNEVEDKKVWRDTVCRAIRRKIESDDEQSMQYQVPPMRSIGPFGPMLFLMVYFIPHFLCCSAMYGLRRKQFERWQESYVTAYKFYHDGHAVDEKHRMALATDPAPASAAFCPHLTAKWTGNDNHKHY